MVDNAEATWPADIQADTVVFVYGTPLLQLRPKTKNYDVWSMDTLAPTSGPKEPTSGFDRTQETDLLLRCRATVPLQACAAGRDRADARKSGAAAGRGSV